MFPADPVLIARGKHATLSRERRALLKRVQVACSMLMDQTAQIMRDSEKEPPADASHLTAAATLLEDAGNARAELMAVCKQIAEIKDLAWGVISYEDYDDKSPSRKEPAEA